MVRVALLASFLLLLAMPSSSEALALRPHWIIISTAAPTYFKAGDEHDYYELIAINDGGAPTDGSTITIADKLPEGVTATAVGGEAGISNHGFVTSALSCSGASSCETEAGTVVPPGEMMRVKVLLAVQSGVSDSELVNDVTISGGGAAAASASSSTPIDDAAVPFGAAISSTVTGLDGAAATQAGSHDFSFTTMLALNVAGVDSEHECHESPGCPLLNAEAKNIRLELPAGMTGNPQAAPRCRQPDFQSFGDHNCPPDTQVGSAQLFFYGGGTATQYAPVYNIEAPPGVPGEIGFTAAGQNHIPVFFHLRSDSDYGLTTSLTGISEADPVHVALLTLWGVPADPSHDSQRQGPANGGCEEGCRSEALSRPFLRLPTDCPGAPLEVGLATDSWQNPGVEPELPSATMSSTSGCDALSFKPSLEIQPDTLKAGAPAGYTTQLKTPQSEDPAGLSSPDMRAAVVTMPPGTTLSASAANGLEACPLDQFVLDTEIPAACPVASTIGTATVTTPLLEKPLTGHIYLGESECSPCGPGEVQDGRLMPLLVEAEGSGVIIKLSGDARIDQASQTVTLTIKESPRLPISDLKLSLKAGEDALLANPHACGATFANAELKPWSSPAPVATASQQITLGGCSTIGFTPSMQAGTTETARAGAYGGFAITINRPDGNQELGSFTLSPPPGMLGKLAVVPQCADAQGDAGTCPSTSQVGTASLLAGPGRQPYELTRGKVFLTGPYAGEPFGLSIVVPAEAGPLKLGGTTGSGTIVVRASIAVNEHTGALTLASARLPREVDGVPLDLTRIVLNIDRKGFMFNPTSCAPMANTGSVVSSAGASTPVSLPFQSVDCNKLAFTPKLTGITPAKTSLAGGASLHVKLRFGAGEANVGKLKIALPSQLPTRLTTLQKACRAPVFEANPASCPAGSVVGTGYAQTVVLKSTMAGPAYLVSHGGAAFPDLEVVLQGEGVTLLLDGHTNISKGISSANFSELPDTPVNVFDLVLPEGPGSLLAANLPARARHSMCRQKLVAPVRITSQSGAVLNQRMKIAVAGCPKAKKAKRAQRAGGRRTRRGSVRHK